MAESSVWMAGEASGAGLLEREKRGVWAYYRLVPTAIATIADLLTPPRKRATKKAR